MTTAAEPTIDPRLALLETESPDAARLAELASLAVRVDAGLLRRLRVEFMRDADVDAETDLWFSAIVDSRSSTGFQIAPDVLGYLRARLAARPTVADVRTVMAEAHEKAPTLMRLEEELNGIAVQYGEAGKSAVDVALRPALATVAGGGEPARAIARWILYAWPRLEPVVLDAPNTRTLILSAALILRVRPSGPASIPAESRLASIAWALPSAPTTGRITIGIQLIDGGVLFQEAIDGSPSLEIPATSPALVEVEWNVDGRLRHVVTDTAPGTFVPLDGNPDALIITTLSGDQYRMSATASAEHTHLEPFVPPSPEVLSACVQIQAPDDSEPRGVAFHVRDDIWLTERSIVEGIPTVVARHGDERFTVLHWEIGETDEGHDDELVALRATSGGRRQASAPPIAADPKPDRGGVAGFVRGAPQWFETIIDERVTNAWSQWTGHLAEVPDLPDRRVRSAFVGAPLIIDGELAGVVIDVAPSDRGAGPTLRFATGTYLHSLSARLAWKAPRVEQDGPGVFIVSMGDARGELLQTAEKAIASLGLRPVTLETSLEARVDPSAAVSRSLGESEALIAILGNGPTDVFEPSYERPLIELAFDQASRMGKASFVYVQSNVGPSLAPLDPSAQRDEFRQRLERGRAIQHFATSDELARRASTDLARWKDKNPKSTRAEESGRWPLWELTLDEHGQQDISPASIAAGVQASKVTDLFVLVHGWNIDPSEARSQYVRFLREMSSVDRARDDPPHAAMLGVIWPSVRWRETADPGSARDLSADEKAEIEKLTTIVSKNPDDEAATARLRALLETPPAESNEPPKERGIFGSLVAGARNLLNTATFYQMRARAGELGQRGLGPFLTELNKYVPTLRLHLVGMSIGSRLASYAVAELRQPSTRSPIKSLTLVQAIMSHRAFSPPSEENPRGGTLAGVVRRIEGPLVVTYSSHDVAAQRIYPITAALGGSDSDAPSERSTARGALGLSGALDVRAIETKLQRVGTPYPFEPGHVYNVDASGIVSSHSDWLHPEVAWLVLAAAGAAPVMPA